MDCGKEKPVKDRDLKSCDGRLVRITDIDGDVFEGPAEFFPWEFGLFETGVEGDSLRVEGTYVAESEIRSIEVLHDYREFRKRAYVEDISELFDTRILQESDVEEIYRLERTNPLFYEHCGFTPSRERILQDLVLLPPGKTLRDKYEIGFFDGEELAAVADVIFGYPEELTAYIGFFMLDGERAGRGFGRWLVRELCEWLQQMGFRHVRLAYVKNNPQASHFWNVCGFSPVLETEHEFGHTVVAQRDLLY